MAEYQGIDKIRTLHQHWIGYQLAVCILFSAGISIVIGSLLHFVFGLSFIWAIALFLVCFGLISLVRRPWQVTIMAIVSFLDQTYPELEESSGLVIKASNSLNLLERLQRRKIEGVLKQVPPNLPQLSRRLKMALLLVAASLLLSFGLSKLPIKGIRRDTDNTSSNSPKINSRPPEKILPSISSVNVTIIPPAYTGMGARHQDHFTIKAEEGSSVSWELKTNIDVKQITLIFNEHASLKMQPGKDNLHWHMQKNIDPGFYQVNVDGKLSDLYQVEIIKDMPPVIRINTPKQYTHIDAGEKPRVDINATITDDYGIDNAVIAATVAKGSGEAVKFKEYKISFDQPLTAHNRRYDLSKHIDLLSLNMEPGDELYFFVQAQDNHRQVSKTDVYIVSIQDTAKLLSMDGIVSGVNIKPEFFRSERQIIIDSQKLLRDRDSISKDEFDKRSNELGADQKLLRLRYGKFLGEEDESNMDEDKSGGQLGKAENFGNAAMVMDAYTDKHDNAEDATFLEPTAKAQLKATLNEMWKAELHLRMYSPSEALPFEFKALRLLKDLQQKSRSYVAKTGYNPPQIKLEKRLSGDLSKIAQPVAHQDIKKDNDSFAVLKKTVIILEQLKTDTSLNTSDKYTLQVASQQLAQRATTRPGAYLPAVVALRSLLAGKNKAYNIGVVERAIQTALPVNRAMPHANANTDIGLSQAYFKILNGLNR